MRRLWLPVLLPIADAWVTAQERRILRDGLPLEDAQLRDAAALAIEHPARVRILHVPRIPFPGVWLVSRLGKFIEFPHNQTAGLSARHGIYVRNDRRGDRRLLAHELAHTRQYQQLGGIRPFLRRYLRECFTQGYASAEMEREAEDAARRICRAS